MISFLFLLTFIAVGVAFILTLQNVLTTIRPMNRTTSPPSAWILLIPVVNLVWQFILYGKIKDSINAEYRSRGLPNSSSGTYSWGITSAAIWTTTIIINSISGRTSSIRLLSGLISLIGLVTWITYWIQIHRHKRKLQQLPPEQFENSKIFGSI